MYKLTTLYLYIGYTDNHKTQIGNFIAGTGKEFLTINIIDLHIENQGHNKIDIKPKNFKLLSRDVEYSYEQKITNSLKGKLKPVIITDRGKTAGQLVFEVPLSTYNFDIIYEEEGVLTHSVNILNKGIDTLVDASVWGLKYLHDRFFHN